MKSPHSPSLAAPIAWVLSACRKLLDTRPQFHALLGASSLQPLFEAIARFKTWLLINETSRRCPAFRQRLKSHDMNARKIQRVSRLPETSKESYIKPYPLEDRTRTGILPRGGIVIDESSGSSGAPTNWVRGSHERQAVSKALQLACGMMHGKERIFVLNCFAPGPWATGMNVSMSVADVSWLKSIGPDTNKIDATLREFGSGFRYLLRGYPPFIKRFLDETTTGLSEFDIHLVLGGEGNSEGLRDYFLQTFASVYSSSGASDLEISIGMETDLTIGLRRSCLDDPILNRKLFGTSETPIIFQYNPLDYHIEANTEGEMLFTVLRRNGLIPKIRYNLKDRGSVMTCREVDRLSGKQFQRIEEENPRHLHFPFLFVFGRTDPTVPFFGANLYASDLERVINEHPDLVGLVQSFRMITGEDEELDRNLLISLELVGAKESCMYRMETIQVWIYEALQAVNQDFREVSKMFSIKRVHVECHDREPGPFANADARLKSNYIVDAASPVGASYRKRLSRTS